MRHHRRGDRLEHRAERAAARGNFVRAAHLQQRAAHQHAVGNAVQWRRLNHAMWGPGRPWIRAHPINTVAVVHAYNLRLAAGLAFHEAMLLWTPQGVRLASQFDPPPVANPVVVRLERPVQINMVSADGQTVTVFADSYCQQTGQLFFATPTGQPIQSPQVAATVPALASEPEVVAAPVQPVPVAPVLPGPASSQPNARPQSGGGGGPGEELAERLRTLQTLLGQGLISQEEFDRKRAEVLNSI